MIHFNQYITEADVPKEEILEAIEKDCKLFLAAIGNNTKKFVIFRGMKFTKNFIKKKVRKNRKPLDTKEDEHKIVDELMFEKFKIRGRTKCLFS